MRTQEELQMILEKYCDNVYFRKPSKKMVYPCIRYDLSGETVRYADNVPYKRMRRWSLTVIDEDPTTELPWELEEKIPYCKFDRPYQANGLNHFALILYF